MGRSRYRIFETHYPYFLTSTIVGWLPVFTRPWCVQILFESWKFLQDHLRLSLLGYVVMENHIHWIALGDDLPKEVGDFKSFTARKIIDGLRERGETRFLDQLRREMVEHKTDRDFQLWQEGSHPEQLSTDAMVRQKLEYAHNNPVERGYVDEPQQWRYSSARNYWQLSSLVAVQTTW